MNSLSLYVHEMSFPKRHHYIPQLILNGFTDEHGWLHWCRHREAPDVVRRARPLELFHKNHLYSTVSDLGVKDPSVERQIADLEAEAAKVIRLMINAVRNDRHLALSDAQKSIWYSFFLLQWRRTPENQKYYAGDFEIIGMIEESVEEFLKIYPRMGDKVLKFRREFDREKFIRNERVRSLTGFQENVIDVLERRGIAILKIPLKNKSFVVGSRPVVKFTSPGRTDLNDPWVEMWLPIASDIAVGVGRGDGKICFMEASNASIIRTLNLAIAKQSETVASGSASLTRSIANAR